MLLAPHGGAIGHPPSDHLQRIVRPAATRIVLDSLNALFIQVPDKTLLRTELFRLIQTLKKLGATAMNAYRMRWFERPQLPDAS